MGIGETISQYVEKTLGVMLPDSLLKTALEYVLEAERKFDGQPDKGAAKKAEVIAKLEAKLHDLAPDWVDKLLDSSSLDESLLSWIIDRMVDGMNAFFDGLAKKFSS